MARGTLMFEDTGSGGDVLTPCWPDLVTLDNFNRSLGPVVITNGAADTSVPPACASIGLPWNTIAGAHTYVTVDGDLHDADPITTGFRGFDARHIIYVPLDPVRSIIRMPISLLPVASSVPTDMTLGNVQIRTYAAFDIKIDRCQDLNYAFPTFIPVDDQVVIYATNQWQTYYFQTVIGGGYTALEDSYFQFGVTAPDGAGGTNTDEFDDGNYNNGPHGTGVRYTVVREMLEIEVTPTTVRATFMGITRSVSHGPRSLDSSQTYMRLEVNLSGGTSPNSPSEGLTDGRDEAVVGDISVYSALANCTTVPTCTP